jgi:lipopolysaccharide export system permease protein
VNPAVGVSKSLGLFILYYGLLKFANALGSRLVLEPVTAAWIPNLAMLGLGVWLFFRRR